jgi:hypothetical protein
VHTKNYKIMKKTNYLFTGILATAILFAGCSTQTKYTAFGGGWGMEKNKGFQTPSSTAKTATTTKGIVNRAEETITLNEVIAKNESNLSPEVKAIIAAHKEQIQTLGNKKTITPSEISIKKPSTWKASNLFPKKKVTSSGSGSDTAAWGITAIACSFVGLFVLGILFGILGIVFGAIGINKSLKGLAIAGLILGVIDVAAFFILLAFLL